jgi:hypothetical protein
MEPKSYCFKLPKGQLQLMMDICNSWYDIKTESEEGTDDDKYSVKEIK